MDRYVYRYRYRFILYSCFMFSHTQINIYISIYIHTHMLYIYFTCLYKCFSPALLLLYSYFTYVYIYIYIYISIYLSICLSIHRCTPCFTPALPIRYLIQLSALMHFIVTLYYGTWHWCSQGLLDYNL